MIFVFKMTESNHYVMYWSSVFQIEKKKYIKPILSIVDFTILDHAHFVVVF